MAIGPVMTMGESSNIAIASTLRSLSTSRHAARELKRDNASRGGCTMACGGRGGREEEVEGGDIQVYENYFCKFSEIKMY